LIGKHQQLIIGKNFCYFLIEIIWPGDGGTPNTDKNEKKY